jgi:anti-sigma factor RsiW
MKRTTKASDDGDRPDARGPGQPAPECPFAREVSAYHDGELGAAACEELERHMAQCAFCAEELRQLRRLSQLIAQTPSPVLPDGFVERLHAGVGSARKEVILRMGSPALATAALLLIAFCLLLWQMPAARGRPAEKGELWEIAVTSLRAEAPADAGPEELLTQLIVAGLSPEGGHD